MRNWSYGNMRLFFSPWENHYECCDGIHGENWNYVSLLDLYYNKEGYLITRFKNNEDKENVMA